MTLTACTVEPEVSRPPEPPPPVVDSGWGGLDVVTRGPDDAACAVVLLHGYGARGDDLVSLGMTLARASDCLAVMPAGPEPAPNGSGRQWWPLDDWRRRRAAGEDLTNAVPEGLEDASRRVQGVFRTLDRRGIPPSRVVVAGFSQGAMLATEAGLTAARPLGGIAVLSGTLLARDRWRAAIARHGAPPVLVSHGRQDPVLAFARAEQLRALLREAEVPVEAVDFDGGHTIPPTVRDRLSRFVNEHVGRSAR